MVEAETILSTFSGVVGAVLGAAGSYVVMRTRQRRITDRRRAGTYFDRQAENLLRLYAQLRECFDVLCEFANRAENGGEITLAEFEGEVEPAVASFEDALGQASLFLSDAEYDAVRDVFEVFARTELALHWRATNPDGADPPPEKAMNWEELSETYCATRDRLRAIIRERYAAAE